MDRQTLAAYDMPALIETRTALRDVQHNLRKQVDSLGAFLAFVNIALVPLIVAGFAIVLASVAVVLSAQVVQCCDGDGVSALLDEGVEILPIILAASGGMP